MAKDSFSDTNSKKLISNLEDKVAELQDVIDTIPANIYWKDKEGVYLGCNKSAMSSIALTLDNNILSTPDDIVGKTNYDMFDKESADVLTENDKYALDSREDQVYEEYYVMENGEAQYFLSLKSPRIDECGNVVGLIGSSFDITEQKRLESDLKEALEKSAADAKAKKAFIDNLSHDIRTPLTGILGLVEAIRSKSEDNPEISVYSSILADATTSFIDFFNDILATVEDVGSTDKGEKLTTLINVKKLAEECRNLFLPAITEKNLSFEISGLDSIPAAFRSKKKILMRILTNLLGNAVKFTKRGKIELSFAKQDGLLKISVIDSGIGIAKEAQKKIFERFSQLSLANTGRYKGSGLGLFMVKKYVESLNGTIELESKLRSGSRFTITIPVVFQADNTYVNFQSKDTYLNEKELSICAAIRPKNILVVEDNELAAFALNNMLIEYKHKVDFAENGTIALEKLKSQKYDLVFLDQDLPDISGDEILARLRQLKIQKDTVVIILSGHICSNSDSLDCQDMVVKPMNKKILVRIFNKFLATEKDLATLTA